jgi:hypothetical protein
MRERGLAVWLADAVAYCGLTFETMCRHRVKE